MKIFGLPLGVQSPLIVLPLRSLSNAGNSENDRTSVWLTLRLRCLSKRLPPRSPSEVQLSAMSNFFRKAEDLAQYPSKYCECNVCLWSIFVDNLIKVVNIKLKVTRSCPNFVQKLFFCCASPLYNLKTKVCWRAHGWIKSHIKFKL